MSSSLIDHSEALTTVGPDESASEGSRRSLETATIEFDVPTEMRDGTVLRADVFRPQDGESPRPVLLVRTPYGKRTSPALWKVAEPLIALGRGFIVVLQDCRGRGRSGGEFRPWVHEADDGADTVAWAATLPGSSGEVVMAGASYVGNTQWMAASTNPPGLRALAPMNTWTDPLDGLFRRGGAEELGLSLYWGLLMGVETVARRNAANPDELAPALAAIVSDLDRLGNDGYEELPAAAHPLLARHQVVSIGNQEVVKDPTLADKCTIADKLDQVQVPAFNVGGWYDVFLQGVLDNYTAIARSHPRSRLVVGPWTHPMQAPMQGDVNFGLTSDRMMMDLGRSLVDLQLDWFEEMLRAPGDSDGPSGPPVKIFVMGINKWRDELEWPLARAVDTSLYLHAGGALGPEPGADSGVSTYTYDPAAPVPTVGGALVMAPEFPAGPFDQQVVESRDDVLIFTTAPLAHDLEVTGRVSATLFVATDCVSTDWVVRLCDVNARGVSRNITDGMTRAKHTPAEVTEVHVDMWSTSNVFLAGHCIRVQVTSSNFPRWDRNLNTGEPAETATTMAVAHQRVFHAPDRQSRIVLPVVSS